MTVKVALIEVCFSPADSRFDVVGARHDTGGFIYRLRRESGGKTHIAGSCRGTDGVAAFERAKRVALGAGYTHYKMKNTGGTPIPLA